MARIALLGVPIDVLTTNGAVEHLRNLLSGTGQQHVITPNSEMLVEAARNDHFRSVLQAASVNLPDSAGLLWAARRTGQQLPERVAGADTVQQLCAELGPEHPVFLLGAAEGVGCLASEVLRSRNPQLQIVGTYAGSPSPGEAPAIIERINAAGPHLLLVAYGAPQQDLWIADHLHELPSVRVAMGVGGTFDFLAGTAKRAPRWMQNLGLEWLWRLIREPWRWRRIWNAVVVFPLLVLRYGRGAPGQKPETKNQKPKTF